jgi:hypothetical protein
MPAYYGTPEADALADALSRADADDDSNRDRDATLEDLERRLEALEED